MKSAKLLTAAVSLSLLAASPAMARIGFFSDEEVPDIGPSEISIPLKVEDHLSYESLMSSRMGKKHLLHIDLPPAAPAAPAPQAAPAIDPAVVESLNNEMNSLRQKIKKQTKELYWLTHRLNKMGGSASASETDELLAAYDFPEYQPSDKPAPKVGSTFKLFGHNYSMTELGLGDKPLFASLSRFTLAMPYPGPNCCKKGAPVIRTGFSSYPRTYLPFSDAYGPPGHRVKIQNAKISDYAADFSIGVMSDYGNHYISAVINIELEPGLFFVVRIGYNQQNGTQYTNLDGIAKEIHRMMDAIVISEMKTPAMPPAP